MKKALGKGLNALIPDTYKEEVEVQKPAQTTQTKGDTTAESSAGGSTFRLIPIQKIQANADQPRKEFTPEGIDELASSIKEKGILQPIIVKQESGDRFTIICGERRFRASQLCGLTEVPAVVKDVASEDLLEWALIENIQREDLNPIEEAQAYQKLSEDRGFSQEEISKRVGKDRTTVTNTMRLLRLPDEVQNYLAAGRLSSGHARALLGFLTPEHQRQMARKIVEENLSVRQVEAIARRSNAQKRRAKKARHLAPEIVDLETRLEQHLGTQIKIYPRKDQKQGRLEIHYFSLDDLDRVLSKIGLSRG